MPKKMKIEDLIAGHILEAAVRDGVPTLVVETAAGRRFLVDVMRDDQGTASGRLHVYEPATGQFAIVGGLPVPRDTTDPRERGRRGGKARARKLTAAQLSNIGRLGALATNALLKRRAKSRASRPMSLVRRRPRKPAAGNPGAGTPPGSPPPSR